MDTINEAFTLPGHSVTDRKPRRGSGTAGPGQQRLPLLTLR